MSSDFKIDPKISQFIYGKYVGDSCGYGLIACTSDLEGHKESLERLMESTYHFWGSQPPKLGNGKAAGICINTTGFLEEKRFLLLQVSPAVDERGNSLASGGRGFSYSRFLFLDQKEIALFNRCSGVLLANLLTRHIPYFDSQPTDEGWAAFDRTIFHVNGNNSSKRHFIFSRDQISLRSQFSQALSTICQHKRLLLTLDAGKDNPVEFLDNLLCWIPVSCRKELSIALGTIDEKYCSWAKIIVKNNGSPRDPLPSDMVWLDRGSNRSYPNTEDIGTHPYVEDFILTPIDEKWISASDIQEYLSTFEDDDFDFNNPSLDFIFQYPATSKKCIEFLLKKYLSKVIEPLKDYIKNLSSLEADIRANTIELLWTVLREAISEKDHLYYFLIDAINLLLKEIVIFRPLKFLEILQKQELDKISSDLLARDFLKLFSPLTLDEDCKKSVTEFIFKTIDIEQDSERKKALVINCVKHRKLFSDDEYFELLSQQFGKQTTHEAFIRVLIDQLINYLPNIRPTQFKEGTLYQHLTDKYKGIATDLLSLLERKSSGDLKYLSKVADALKLSLSDTNMLYLAFAQSWNIGYDEGLPIVLSSIEKSVTVSPEKAIQFNKDAFLEIYDFFGKFEDGLTSAIENLDKNPDSWLSWKSLADILSKSAQNDIVHFMDKVIGTRFPAKVLTLWLDLAGNPASSHNWAATLAESRTWKSLTSDNIAALQHDLDSIYSEHVPNFVKCAYEEGRKELIPGTLLGCLESRWIKNGCIEEDLWRLLNNDSMFSSLNAQVATQYWIKLFRIKLSTRSSFDLSYSYKPSFSEAEKKELESLIGKMIADLNHLDNSSEKEMYELLQKYHSVGLDRWAMLENSAARVQHINQAKQRDAYYINGAAIVGPMKFDDKGTKEKKRALLYDFSKGKSPDITVDDREKLSELVIEGLNDCAASSL